jgi:hypothetical protein
MHGFHVHRLSNSSAITQCVANQTLKFSARAVSGTQSYVMAFCSFHSILIQNVCKSMLNLNNQN